MTVFADANFSFQWPESFSFHPTVSLHEEMKTMYNEHAPEIQNSRSDSKDKVSRGQRILGVAKFISWYTLGVSLSVKLAPGIFQSYIFQEIYLRVEIQVEIFAREILKQVYFRV